MAATHLSSDALGHILGLGLRAAPANTVTATLKEQCGITSNRVNGEWTGVSLARYRRIVEHVAAGARGGPSIPLFLHFVWERAESKVCLLGFLLALDSHVACLQPEWRERLSHDQAAREAWCAARFAPQEVDTVAVDEAAHRVLTLNSSDLHTPPAPSTPWSMSMSMSMSAPSTRPASSASGVPGPSMCVGHALEVLGAHLCAVSAFKPPNVLERHSYGGGAPRPDCVEMCV